MGDHLTVMFGYFLVKLSKPFCTRASSAGDDDHPVTLSVTLPDSALAADVFVLEGHASSGFFEPLTLAPVPPETLLPAPHAESSATSASAASAPHSRRSVPLREPFMNSSLLTTRRAPGGQYAEMPVRVLHCSENCAREILNFLKLLDSLAFLLYSMPGRLRAARDMAITAEPVGSLPAPTTAQSATGSAHETTSS